MDVLSPPTSPRNGLHLNHKIVIALELLLVGLVLIPYTITPLIFIFAWLSLWLRKLRWKDIGLRRSPHWIRVILFGLPIGIGWPFLDIFVVEPWIESLTGEQVDLSLLIGIKDNLTAYIIMIAVVWTLAAFGEELVYRGYLLNRMNDLIGRMRLSWIISLVPVSVCFGLAHSYQGISGMIETGYVGFVLGVFYFASGRNLWLPILIHGLYDTVGISFLFLGIYPK
jgi:hypothetical protein